MQRLIYDPLGARRVLTDDVVVSPSEELQAPQIGAELLKLEGELDVLVGLDAVEERRVGLGDGAALQLLPGHHVHLVILHAIGHPAVHARAHNVQLIPDLGVQYHALAWHESGRGDKEEEEEKEEGNGRKTSLSFHFTAICLAKFWPEPPGCSRGLGDVFIGLQTMDNRKSARVGEGAGLFAFQRRVRPS